MVMGSGLIVRFGGMLMSGRRVAVSLLCMRLGGSVIALLMMLGSRAVRFCGLVVMFSSFVMCVFRHGKTSVRLYSSTSFHSNDGPMNL
jgi:hypothetical protein